MAWTGDRTVDYILNSRYAKAAEAGIPMEMNIEYPYNTNIKANDACTILSNLLDNALEAAAAMSRQCPLTGAGSLNHPAYREYSGH